MKVQKRIAGIVFGISPKRVIFNKERLDEVKDAITRRDIKLLIGKKIITKKAEQGVSRSRANKILSQKRKGRQKGHGSRKGKATARLPSKPKWIAKIRKQRTFIKTLKDKELIDNKVYRELYRKSKGGFFRNQRHVKLYLQEKGILK